jgi:hypothetical protein
MSAALPGLIHRRARWRFSSGRDSWCSCNGLVVLLNRPNGLGATLETKPVVEAVLGWPLRRMCSLTAGLYR